MRSTGFLIIISIILFIYSLANYYLCIRGIQVFSLAGPAKKGFIAAFTFVAALFVAGIFLERGASSVFSEWVFRFGSFWLAFMLYFILILLAIDIVRIADYFFHFLPQFSPLAKLKIGWAVVAVVVGIVSVGFYNAVSVKVTHIPLKINKKVEGKPNIRILMASDLHLGALIGQNREKKLLEIIHEQNPDLVLFCGDLVDSEIAPVLRKKLGEHIQEIETPLGVYAVLGNHEYIGGITKTLPYLKNIKIKMLVDTVVTLPNGIQVAGRNDRAVGQHGQMPLNELLANADRSKPVIVMNHQPYHLEEASSLGVDLHLSGHTHNGQMWPFNYITRKIFEVSWGYLKKGDTHFYVSCGFGTWGPMVRIGSRSEIVVFDIDFSPEV